MHSFFIINHHYKIKIHFVHMKSKSLLTSVPSMNHTGQVRSSLATSTAEDCIKTFYGRVQIILHEVKWKRFHHVMAYAANPNYTTYSSHLILFYFLSETLITWQTQILLDFEFARNPNYTTFSSHYFSFRIRR